MVLLECSDDDSKTTKRWKNDSKTKKRKRKKRGEKKLLIGEKVEVRHFDRGLQGSWSFGVVVKCEESFRHVEYADLFSDDDSSKLIEAVCVPPAVDGILPKRRTTKTGRGNIRPLPPYFHIKSSKLCYGLCVDVLVDHAWWEGIIFDHDEGAGKRLIFFPDEGDQSLFDVDQLRASQDWDEVSGGWKRRGDWLFLDFVRKMKQWVSLPVSVRQIWYDVRANAYLRGKDLDWTCRDKCLWKKLVLEAIQENTTAAEGGISASHDFVFNKNLAACKRRKKTSKSFVLASSVGLGGQMDESDLQMFDEQDQTEENLDLGQSKRSKTFASQNFASMGVSELPVGEPFTHSEVECIGQGNQICHPILDSQSEMDVATFEDGFQVRSMDVIDGQKDGNQKILSAPIGCRRANDFASGRHFANVACKTRKSCIIQSSASTSVLMGELVDYDFKQRLQSSNECGAEKNHLSYGILTLPSEPNAAVHGTDIQDSSLNSCSLYFDKGLSPSSQAVLAFQFDLGSCPPSCPEALPESHSLNCNDNHVYVYLESDGSLGLESHSKPSTNGHVLTNGPANLNYKSYLSPSGACHYSCAEISISCKDGMIVYDNLSGTGGNMANYDGQGVKLYKDPAHLEKEADEPSRGARSWQPVSNEVLSMAAYFPDSVLKYCTFSQKNKHCLLKGGLSQKVKQHLLFIGWKWECRQGKKYVQNRYLSPGGKVYSSLYTACTYLKEQEVNVQSPGNADASMANYSSCKNDPSHVAMINSETACLMLQSVENSRVTGTKANKEEHSSWSAEIFLVNQDAKARGIVQGAGQSFNQMTSADGPSDSDVQQVILLPGKLDEQQDPSDGPCVAEENCARGSPEREISSVFGSEYCPEAVIDYYFNCGSTGKCKQSGSSEDIKKIKSKAKMHLSADGWKFWHVGKGNGRELRFGQPNGRCFSSLRRACKAWIEAKGMSSRLTVHPQCEVDVSKRSKGPLVDETADDSVNTASTCFKLQRSTQPLHDWPWGGPGWSSGSSLSNRPGSGHVRLTGARKCRKRRNYSSCSAVSQRLPCGMNAHLLSWSAIAENVKPSGLPMFCGKTVKCFPYRSSGSQKRKKHMSSAARIIQYKRSHGRSLTRVLRSSKRAPQTLVPCSSQPRGRTILSWLIDNEVVLPRQKVHYIHGKDRCVLAEGRINRGGIKCKCCKKVFSLTSFELHAGSRNHRPGAHIFLEDGRSLLECQMQLVHCEKLKGLGSDAGARMKRDCSHCKTDNICSICHYGGKLVLCDYCPSSFHLSCINLKEVPEGSWACPTCRCGICGKSDFDGNSEQFTEKTILYCDQCRREYHVGCLRKRGMTRIEGFQEGHWFCSNKCSKLFLHIQKIVGKRKQTDVAGLSWTLLSPRKDVNCALDRFETEATVDLHSKISIALGILHECFVPITEPRTKRDLITDVIFNQGSELKRLNFRGFYTMVLERGDELISAATVRIHGLKVAEMPLIGTCVQYRQQGMCRLLVNELEKMLSDLGVERLLLPATSQMLPKWITSFGFTPIMAPERFQFLEFTFLDFQGTSMCQKVLQPSLVKAPKSRPGEKKNKGPELCLSGEGMDSGKQSSISVVTQTVTPVAALLSMGAQVHPLHDKVGTGEEIIRHSFPSNDGAGTEVLSQEQLQKCKMATRTLIKFTTDEGSSNAVFVETFPMIDVPKQRTEAQWKFFGLCYWRKRKLDIMRKYTDNNNAVTTERNRINRFVKHYKRRKILTHEVSSIQSTGEA